MVKTVIAGGKEIAKNKFRTVVQKKNKEEELEEEQQEEGKEEEEDDEEESMLDTDETSAESDGFEDQGSSSEEGSPDEDEEDEESDIDAEETVREIESSTRQWTGVGVARQREIDSATIDGSLQLQQYLHTDDLSSDDEDELGNTVGRIPLHWYDAYDHVGYNISGEKVVKRSGKDRLDMALSARDDPNSNRTVYDMYNDREVVLSDRDLEIIRRLQAGAFAHPEFNDTPDYVDYESGVKEVFPLMAAPEPKRRFVASKWELMRITKIVKAMKEGKYKTMKELEEERKSEKGRGPYMVWNDQEDDILAESRRFKYHLPAPKIPLPGHAESYNPPPEYLLTDEEKNQYDELDPTERPYNFIPHKSDCLRHVKGYGDFIKERFERCLDLYLCPRKLKKRLNIDPESLIPTLPKPKELKPFPNSLCLQYLGHSKAVRAISVSPDGQYLATGSEDCSVRLWEVDTCLCVNTWLVAAPVTGIAWNPCPSHHILAAVVKEKVVFIATGTGDEDATELTDSLINAAIALATSVDDEKDENLNEEKEDNEDGETVVRNAKKLLGKWCLPMVVSKQQQWMGSSVGPRLELQLSRDIKHICWHQKGDYLSVLTESTGVGNVTVHQLSKGNSQAPFTKSPGNVQAVCFHPFRPYLFIATQQHVKVYHLVEQKLVKKLLSGCKWLSSIDIHPSGDHVILGSYDRRVVWFDLDLSSTPYKTLKYHEKAIRDVHYHRKYPLMASGSDDGTVHIFHAAVYSDLSRSPLIVPLKILKGHGVVGGLGVLAVEFHPKQPWIFSAGADGVVNLFQDI